MKDETMWILIAVAGVAAVAYYMSKHKGPTTTIANPSTGTVVPAMSIVSPQTTVGKLITGGASLLNSFGV